MVGALAQGQDCMERLVSLRTALGGEIVAIVRERVGGWGRVFGPPHGLWGA